MSVVVAHVRRQADEAVEHQAEAGLVGAVAAHADAVHGAGRQVAASRACRCRSSSMPVRSTIFTSVPSWTVGVELVGARDAQRDQARAGRSSHLRAGDRQADDAGRRIGRRAVVVRARGEAAVDEVDLVARHDEAEVGAAGRAAVVAVAARNRPAKTLIAKRKSKRDMGDHGIAESVVLDDVLEDALEACAGPVAGQAELFAEDAELGLHRVAIERRHLRIVGDVVDGVHVERRIAIRIEERRGLR